MGKVTSETDFQLGAATIRRPDAAVITTANFKPAYGTMVPIPIAPDLVFEVVSAQDRAGALRIKVRQYLTAGTKAVWLLYPQLEEARRFCAEHPLGEVRGAVEEPGLLPGFSMSLAEVFAPIEL